MLPSSGLKPGRAWCQQQCEPTKHVTSNTAEHTHRWIAPAEHHSMAPLPVGAIQSHLLPTTAQKHSSEIDLGAPLGDGPAGSPALIQQPEGGPAEMLDDAVRHREKEQRALPSFLRRGSRAPLLVLGHDAPQGPGACRQNSNNVSCSLPRMPPEVCTRVRGGP